MRHASNAPIFHILCLAMFCMSNMKHQARSFPFSSYNLNSIWFIFFQHHFLVKIPQAIQHIQHLGTGVPWTFQMYTSRPASREVGTAPKQGGGTGGFERDRKMWIHVWSICFCWNMLEYVIPNLFTSCFEVNAHQPLWFFASEGKQVGGTLKLLFVKTASSVMMFNCIPYSRGIS